MSNPPDHLSHRTLLPGALLAILVTAGALFALAVVIAVGPDGPARLWLDGGGSTTNLETRAGAQAGAAGGLLAGSPAGLLTDAPTAGVKGAVTLAATPRTAAQLRGSARVQRRTRRLPATGRPAPTRTSPNSPTRLVSTPTPTSARPVATPAPGGSVVKTRERGDDSSPSPAPVQKQRAAKPAPSGDGAPAQPAPASTPAPVVDKTPVRPTAQQDTSVGLEDGALIRVPAPAAGSGG